MTQFLVPHVPSHDPGGWLGSGLDLPPAEPAPPLDRSSTAARPRPVGWVAAGALGISALLLGLGMTTGIGPTGAAAAGSILLAAMVPFYVGRSTRPHTTAVPGPAAPAGGPGHRPRAPAPDLPTIFRRGQYCLLLQPSSSMPLPPELARAAWRQLETEMALVPTGRVMLSGAADSLAVDAFYLDRHAVTNARYLEFVQAGGYEQIELWPQEVWPSLLVKFVDRSGQPGPRSWVGAKYPEGLARHPVVGVCWYEAAAYAAWLGKRLPTGAEWHKAASWPTQASGAGPTCRYPWGNSFDQRLCNLWAAGRGGTAPVDSYPDGCTPNGIFQLAGNVWEWTSDPLSGLPLAAHERIVLPQPMRRVLGGAFDTYFDSQAACQFVTGHPELDRRDNIGFRTAISAADLKSPEA